MNSKAILGLALTTLMFSHGAAAGKYDYRSCNGKVTAYSYIDSEGPDFNNLQVIPQATAKVQCDYKLPSNMNECRIKARKALQRCFRDHVAGPGALPASCTPSASVTNWSVNSMTDGITKKVCEKGKKYRGTTYKVGLRLETWGDNYCGLTTQSDRHLEINTDNCN